MTLNLVENLRQSRKSPSVLKTKILSIRSREAAKPIFVFEGLQDVGPYNVWIGRCDDALAFMSLPANGKDQILLFRQNLGRHESVIYRNIYFFIDRDFDDLKGFSAASDIFLTDRYSIENYLVSERVLCSILIDEFKCADEPIDAVLSIFNTTMRHFVDAMSSANRRLFRARRLLINSKNSGIEDQITKYVTISLEKVVCITNLDDLRNLIPFEREPTEEEALALDAEFDDLDPRLRHRGKFLLAFFLKWLDLLVAERSSRSLAIFASSSKSRFSSQQLTMRSLATRSDIPLGLCNFVKQANTSDMSNMDAGP